ncbi:MAG: GTP cyclohydrolase, FolE2/MptA family [Promethearchaeota archaeon]|jgi:GTP cyclohydrolase-4
MDLQDSESAIDIAIDKVGIVGLEKKVEIVQENKKYSFYPKISALIDLPSQQRGVHMSRTSETIEEVINEVIYKPTPTIELVGDRIVRKLLEKHSYTSKAEVKLEGKIIVQVRENNTRNIQKSYNIISFVKAKRIPSKLEKIYTFPKKILKNSSISFPFLRIIKGLMEL